MAQHRNSPTLISSLPTEIVDAITANLNVPTLKAARLVNQRWHESATTFLFRTITMNPTSGGVRRWRSVLNSTSFRFVPTRAILKTCPIPECEPWNRERPLEEQHAISEWDPWAWRDQYDAKKYDPKTWNPNGSVYLKWWFEAQNHHIQKYTSFYGAFPDLTDLPALREVSLHFTPSCLGERDLFGGCIQE
jgi:hypothetical protein